MTSTPYYTRQVQIPELPNTMSPAATFLHLAVLTQRQGQTLERSEGTTRSLINQ